MARVKRLSNFQTVLLVVKQQQQPWQRLCGTSANIHLFVQS